jgi:hypothetical protein
VQCQIFQPKMRDNNRAFYYLRENHPGKESIIKDSKYRGAHAGKGHAENGYAEKATMESPSDTVDSGGIGAGFNDCASRDYG